jgi:hypothetical protein
MKVAEQTYPALSAVAAGCLPPLGRPFGAPVVFDPLGTGYVARLKFKLHSCWRTPRATISHPSAYLFPNSPLHPTLSIYAE